MGWVRGRDRCGCRHPQSTKAEGENGATWGESLATSGDFSWPSTATRLATIEEDGMATDTLAAGGEGVWTIRGVESVLSVEGV